MVEAVAVVVAVAEVVAVAVVVIPPVYEEYPCVCVCKLFFSSKISQQLLDLGF